MSNDWERREREKSDKRRLALLIAVEYGIEDNVQALGGTLTGFSVSIRGVDYLMTLRARFEEKAMIAFVGAGTLGDLVIKAADEAKRNKLHWKPDRYEKG